MTISGNIKRIGERAFYGCKNLQNLEIEEGVKEIGGQALGKGYLKIGKYAFSDCDSLTKGLFVPDGWSLMFLYRKKPKNMKKWIL